MTMEGTVKPCPICNTKMVLRKVSSLGECGQRKWFYFMYCRQCGYGPMQAYDSGLDAIYNWNLNALSNSTAKKLNYPHMF